MRPTLPDGNPGDIRVGPDAIGRELTRPEKRENPARDFPHRGLRTERDATVSWLAARGLHVADTDANFVLFGSFEDRHAIWRGLVERGVLIRETGPDGWLRVSIGTSEEMTAFRDALVEVAGL